MQLIVMRHGEAAWNQRDFDRELTEHGRHSVADVASQIAQSPWRPRQIWCSPLVRARQTAAIVSEILNCPVRAVDGITPDDDPGRLLDSLLEADESPLMLVSHMPFVGALATLLVDGHRQGIPFMTAQAVMLDMPVAGAGCADLKAQFLS